MQLTRATRAARLLAYAYAHESLGKERVLDWVFEQLQAEQLVRIGTKAFSLDSTSVKVHRDGTGALKTDPNAAANPAADGNRIHMVAAGARR